jgi:hypothetical protein
LSADRFAELLTFFRIFDARIERPLCETDGQGGDADPSAVQHSECLFESFADGADQVLFRDADVIEDERSCFAAPHSEFILFLAGSESGSSLFHNEGGDRFALGLVRDG